MFRYRPKTEVVRQNRTNVTSYMYNTSSTCTCDRSLYSPASKLMLGLGPIIIFRLQMISTLVRQSSGLRVASRCDHCAVTVCVCG